MAQVPTTIWQRTRRAASEEIVRAALRLFAEQGFDETPMSQIAQEAGVSERTLFRYFGTKQDLLGGDQERFVAAMAAAIDEQPAELGVWDVLRAAIAAAVQTNDDPGQALQLFRLLQSTPSLRASWLDKRLRYGEAMLPLIVARAREAGRDEIGVRAVVACAFACLDAAAAAWVAADGDGDLMTLYDRCVTAVRSA
jgi:AcrR family transcriptional regulator